MILIGVVALVGIGSLFWGISRAKHQKDDIKSMERNANLSADITRDEKSLKAKEREKLNEQALKKRQVDSQLAQSPISVEGVNNAAATFYALSDQDVEKVNQVVSDIRLKVANVVIGGMVDLADPKDAARAVIFRGSNELAEQIKSDFYNKLEQIGGADFARNGVKALQNDARFLGAGGRDVYLYVNPGDSKNSAVLERVRLEIMTEDKSQSSKWEGPPENMARGYLLKLEL